MMINPISNIFIIIIIIIIRQLELFMSETKFLIFLNIC